MTRSGTTTKFVFRRNTQRIVAAVAYFAIALLSVVEATHSRSPVLPALIAGISAAVSARLWFAATVVADPHGVRVRELYRTRVLPWPSVVHFDTELVYMFGQTRRCLVADTSGGVRFVFRGFNEVPRRNQPSSVARVADELNAMTRRSAVSS